METCNVYNRMDIKHNRHIPRHSIKNLSLRLTQERIAINYTLLKLIFTNLTMYYSLLGAWGR